MLKLPAIDATIPAHFPIKALKLKKLCRWTPARIAFISGTPDPSASLAMYSLKSYDYFKALTRLRRKTSSGKS
jgi:hypothetical protein